jgi:glycine dehydrogenase subunit 2
MLPAPMTQGALHLMAELERYLAEITAMDAVSLQPAAGAQGELAGMLLIHGYLKKPQHGTEQDHHSRYGPWHQSGQCRPLRVSSRPVASGEAGILTPDAVAR